MYKFFCDIYGTFSGKDSDAREKDVEKFASLLNKLAGNRELSFSFISTEPVSEIEEYMEELGKYIKNSKVKFGTQYGERECIKDQEVMECVSGKQLQIMEDVREGNYQKVFFADDSKITHIIVKKIFDKKMPHIPVVQFVTGRECEAGLTGLIDLMETYIKQIEKDQINH